MSAPKIPKRYPGLSQALDALESVDASTREKILQNILKKDPALVQQLKEGRFQFTDLQNLKFKDLQNLKFSDLQNLLAADFRVLWWECSRADWILALRKTSPEVNAMLQSHLSKRAFAELTEQVQEQGPQLLRKVLEAQEQIVLIARQLIQDGRMAAPSPQKRQGRL